MNMLIRRPTRAFFDSSLQRVFDNFYDDFFSDFNPFEQLGKANYPKCNVIDKKDAMVVQAAIPGLKKDEIELEVNDADRTITLRSRTSSAETYDDKDDIENEYLSREIKFSSFSRTFLVKDKNLNLTSIDAKHENGILELHIPKKEPEQAEPRKIPIA